MKLFFASLGQSTLSRRPPSLLTRRLSFANLETSQPSFPPAGKNTTTRPPYFAALNDQSLSIINLSQHRARVPPQLSAAAAVPGAVQGRSPPRTGPTLHPAGKPAQHKDCTIMTTTTKPDVLVDTYGGKGAGRRQIRRRHARRTRCPTSRRCPAQSAPQRSREVRPACSENRNRSRRSRPLNFAIVSTP
jgi:hypothetical protein